VEFIESDVLKGLPFDDNTFDYVHQGYMAEMYTMDLWYFMTSEIIR